MGFWKELFKKRLPDGMVDEPIRKDVRPPTPEELRKAREGFEETKAILEKEGTEYQRQLREVRDQQKKLDEMDKHLDWQGRKLDQLHEEAKDLLKQANAYTEQARAEKEQARAEKEQARAYLTEYNSVKQVLSELKSNDPDYKTKLQTLRQRAEKLRVQFKRATGEDYDIWSELTEPPNSSGKGS